MKPRILVAAILVVLFTLGCSAGRGNPDLSQSPDNLTAVARVKAQGEAQPSKDFSFFSTPAPTLSTGFKADLLRVGNTGGEGVYIRRGPTMGDKIKAWPDTTIMMTVGEGQEVEGRTWKNVKDPDGNIGWIPAEYLVDLIELAEVKPENRPISKPDLPSPSSKGILVNFTGLFEPRILRIGEKLVIKLGVTNKTNIGFNGVRIFSTGPWDKYTIVNVMPSGKFESGFLGHNFYSSMTFPSDQTRYVNIVAYPNEAGNHDFSFVPHELSGNKLIDEDGDQFIIGGKVSVLK